MTQRTHSIDCFRLIACFLVVNIHFPFPGELGNILIAFGKTAVPFFLVICGYFLYREDDELFLTRIKKQAKKLLILTILANLLFMVFDYILLARAGMESSFSTNYLNPSAIMNFILYNESSFAGHLWYLGSLFYALVMLYFIAQAKAHRLAMFLSPVLLGIYIYLSKTGSEPFFVYRNALLVTLPYVMMGCLIRRYEKKILSLNGIVYISAAAILCITNFAEYKIYQTVAIPFFSAELLVYVIVILLLKYPNLGAGTVVEKIGNRYTLTMYIIHFMPVAVLLPMIRNQQIALWGTLGIFVGSLIASVAVKEVYSFLTGKIYQVNKEA